MYDFFKNLYVTQIFYFYKMAIVNRYIYLEYDTNDLFTNPKAYENSL